MKKNLKEPIQTLRLRLLHRLYKYADIAINGAVKEQQNRMLKELKEKGKLEEFKNFSNIMDLIISGF